MHPRNSTPAPWLHRRPQTTPPRPVTLSDVAVGMSVSASQMQDQCGAYAWMGDNKAIERACTDASCQNILACARASWMVAAPQLEVLLLVDCHPLCAARIADVNATGDTSQKASIPEDCLASPCSPDCGPKRYDGFPHPPWLRPSRKHLAKLHFRCYYGRALSQRRMLFGMQIKTRTLFTALLNDLGHKRFFLKLDTDAMLQPANLLRFLSLLGAHVHPASPLYFGTSFTSPWIEECYYARDHHGFVAPTDVDGECHTFRFNQGVKTKAANASRHYLREKPLRESQSFRRLLAEVQPDKAVQARLQGASVHYAAGGSYGISKPALLALNERDLLKHLGKLSCDGRPCTRGTIHKAEDAGFGLCMHLLAVTLIEYPCFMESKFSQSRQTDERRLQVLLHDLQTATPERMSKWRREQACQAPITLHPLKHGYHYMSWWRLLGERNGSMLPLEA